MSKNLCIWKCQLRNSLWVQYAQPWLEGWLLSALYVCYLQAEGNLRPTMSIPARRRQRPAGESPTEAGEQSSVQSLTLPLRPLCFLSLSLFTSLNAYLLDLIFSSSQCLAMLAQIKSLVWTDSHMLQPSLWINKYLLRDDCSQLVFSTFLDLWLHPFLICSCQQLPWPDVRGIRRKDWYRE